MLYRQIGSRQEPKPLQIAKSFGAPVGNAADPRGCIERPAHQCHLIAARRGCILLRDDVSVRIDLRVAENGGNAVFKTLRNKVLQSLCFLMHFIPGILQNVVKEQVKQAVMPHQFPAAALSGGREPNPSVLLI